MKPTTTIASSAKYVPSGDAKNSFEQKSIGERSWRQLKLSIKPGISPQNRSYTQPLGDTPFKERKLELIVSAPGKSQKRKFDRIVE